MKADTPLSMSDTCRECGREYGEHSANYAHCPKPEALDSQRCRDRFDGSRYFRNVWMSPSV